MGASCTSPLLVVVTMRYLVQNAQFGLYHHHGYFLLNAGYVLNELHLI